jgi:UDP:flavonoid glycosyltransferase YjiC (YdhE family)
MASVLLVACESDAGAWPPVAALSHELAQQGHIVRVLCDRPIEHAFEGKIIGIPSDFQSKPYIDNRFAELFQQIERGEPIEDLTSPLLTWANALAPVIPSQIKRSSTDIVIGSMFCLPLAIIVARELEVPVVSLNPGPYVGPNPPRAFEDDYPGLNLWWFEHCVLPPIQQSDYVLHATDQEFDLDFNGLPDNHHYVGPLIWTPAGEAPSEMVESGPPWITASVSLKNQPGELDLIEAILGAADGLDARILLTAPDHDISTLTVPANVMLTRFVSHAAALEHSRLLLSHAGHGAVMRALWMGVPMVLTPWDRDQMAVAYRAGKLGVARVIDRENVDVDVLHRELAIALSDATLRDCSKHQHERLHQTNPPALAVDLITRFANDNR